MGPTVSPHSINDPVYAQPFGAKSLINYRVRCLAARSKKFGVDEINEPVYARSRLLASAGDEGTVMSDIGRRRAARAAADDPAYTRRLADIREAAVRVFRAKGLRVASLNDVAEELGTSRASLYYYVGSKEELFRDVVSEAVTANIEAAEKVLAQPLPASRKLARLIELLMASFERHYPYLYVFVQEDFSKLGGDAETASEPWDATIREWNQRYFDLVKQVVSEGIAAGDLRTSLPAGVVANCVIGMMNSSHVWFRPNGLMDATELGEGMARMLLAGLEPATGD